MELNVVERHLDLDLVSSTLTHPSVETKTFLFFDYIFTQFFVVFVRLWCLADDHCPTLVWGVRSYYPGNVNLLWKGA